MKEGFVYALRVPGGAVKIGRTVNLEARLKQLQANYGAGCFYLSTWHVSDAAETEYAAHRACQDFLVQREIFYASPVGALDISEPIVERIDRLVALGGGRQYPEPATRRPAERERIARMLGLRPTWVRSSLRKLQKILGTEN